MMTSITNKMIKMITLCVDNIEYDVVKLSDGKILDVVANRVMIYENERKFINCRDNLDLEDHCEVLQYAELDLTPINNDYYDNGGSVS